MNAVRARIGAFSAGDHEQEIGQAERTLFLGLVVLRDEAANLQQMTGAFLDLAAAELDLDQGVASVLEVHDEQFPERLQIGVERGSRHVADGQDVLADAGLRGERGDVSRACFRFLGKCILLSRGVSFYILGMRSPSPTSDPPPPRNHPPPVRIAPEQLDDADEPRPAVCRDIGAAAAWNGTNIPNGVFVPTASPVAGWSPRHDGGDGQRRGWATE